MYAPTFSQIKGTDPWWYVVLGDHNFDQAKGFFAFWYRWTSLPNPGANATFKQLNAFRKSRTAAAFLLYLALVLLIVALVAAFGPNKQIWVVVAVLYPLIAVCCVLNRKGFVTIVGIVLSAGLLAGMCSTLIVTAMHGGISANEKDILFLLFFDELFIAALLPVNWVFLAAIMNVLVSVYILQFAPHTPEFAASLPKSYFSILFRLLQQHFLVPAILWILENKCLAAIKRADRATETARLQHQYSTIVAEKAQEKERLDSALEVIIATHAKVANGDLGARVPLDQPGENVLWSIAVPLNNLMSRYQDLAYQYRNRERLIQVMSTLAQQDPDLHKRIVETLKQLDMLQAGQPSSSIQ